MRTKQYYRAFQQIARSPSTGCRGRSGSSLLMMMLDPRPLSMTTCGLRPGLFSSRSLSSGMRRRREFIVGGPREIVDMTPEYRLRPPNPHKTELEFEFNAMEEPYDHGLPTFDDYLKKVSLSPWVPTPDVVARKMMDLAQVGPDDVHVDLGSGDGRVCFHAIDFGIPKSIGIDIDEVIVSKAQERLKRRHPQPNLEFIVADLLDLEHPAWHKVQEATFITMFFAEEGLRAFRPALERKLAGHKCKILTCGYEMPGWEYRMHEVVLGTKIHRYDWGSEEEDGFNQFLGDDLLLQKPQSMMNAPIENNSKFSGYTVVDRTKENPFDFYSPETFSYYDDDDWEDEISDEDEKDDDDDGTEHQRGN